MDISSACYAVSTLCHDMNTHEIYYSLMYFTVIHNIIIQEVTAVLMTLLA